jgi:hypothetical protein
MAVSHIKSDTIADFTGTITGFNSQGSTVTIAATDLVRPVDWNSAHNQFYTLTGNTTGNSTASGTNVLFAGSGGISIGGSTGTIVFSGPTEATLTGYDPFQRQELVAFAGGNATLWCQPIDLPGRLHFNRFCLAVTHSNATNSSGSLTMSVHAAFYTRNNSSWSSLHSTSFTTGYTASGTVGAYSSHGGIRFLAVPWTTTVTAGNYMFGYVSRTTTGGANMTWGNLCISQIASTWSGFFGSGSGATAYSQLGEGVYSATVSTLPNPINITQVNANSSAFHRAPKFMFMSNAF